MFLPYLLGINNVDVYALVSVCVGRLVCTHIFRTHTEETLAYLKQENVIRPNTADVSGAG